jgi:hypothetical protein
MRGLYLGGGMMICILIVGLPIAMIFGPERVTAITSDGDGDPSHSLLFAAGVLGLWLGERQYQKRIQPNQPASKDGGGGENSK